MLSTGGDNTILFRVALARDYYFRIEAFLAQKKLRKLELGWLVGWLVLCGTNAVDGWLARWMTDWVAGWLAREECKVMRMWTVDRTRSSGRDFGISMGAGGRIMRDCVSNPLRWLLGHDRKGSSCHCCTCCTLLPLVAIGTTMENRQTTNSWPVAVGQQQ